MKQIIICPKCLAGILKWRNELSSVLECSHCGHTVYTGMTLEEKQEWQNTQ